MKSKFPDPLLAGAYSSFGISREFDDELSISTNPPDECDDDRGLVTVNSLTPRDEANIKY